MSSYTSQELRDWAMRVSDIVDTTGLDCFRQEFEICDHNQMLGYMAYSGMPSRYPHWSFGKSFEKQKTLYDYGASGLPYEMVINSDPCLAYLMRDNSLLLQVLTIAHVYGHNDFFKNNYTFRATRPEFTLQSFKLHAERIRSYIEDPSIGIEKVEAILDAAHALSFQCRRYPSGPKLTRHLQETKIREQYESGSHREFSALHSPDDFDEDAYLTAIRKVPLEPEENLLLFIRDNNAALSEWERDLLTIVHDETQYFVPQIETKIMNEGWASYWHKYIMDRLDLPHDMRLEFIVRNAQVLRPHPGGLNPYHVGYQVLNAMRVWFDGSLDRGLLRKDEIRLYNRMKEDYERRDAIPIGTGSMTGHEALFKIRETDRDTSFLRQYLSPALMRELDLFEYAFKRNHYKESVGVVTHTSDTDSWRVVKNTLLRNVGFAGIPVIKVEDGNFGKNGTLLLQHAHDGRDLEAEHTQRTLEYVHRLWNNPVRLETKLNEKETQFVIGSDGKLRTTTNSK